MGKVCEICGKVPRTGNLVSHSKIKTKRRLFPNLQSVRADINGHVKRLRVCTRCLKSNCVKKFVAKPFVKTEAIEALA